jgi:GAF domain-containing protein
MISTDSPATMPAGAPAQAILDWLDAETARPATPWTVLLAQTVESLAEAFEHFHWTGIYLLEGDTLVLGPYVGAPTEHVRIPLGRGICGAAATERQTIVVDDVRADERFLACFLTTRSEIVVPILDGPRVIGEIDVDSDAPAAFGPADRALLEQVAARLARLAPAVEPLETRP